MVASPAELGIDRPDHVPVRLTDDLLRQADVVVALKSRLSLDVPTGVDQQTWNLPNPADWDIDSIRPLRDHIRQKVHELIDQLVGVGRPTALRSH
jgi:protein-tyrosine-phosphatase